MVRVASNFITCSCNSKNKTTMTLLSPCFQQYIYHNVTHNQNRNLVYLVNLKYRAIVLSYQLGLVGASAEDVSNKAIRKKRLKFFSISILLNIFLLQKIRKLQLEAFAIEIQKLISCLCRRETFELSLAKC